MEIFHTATTSNRHREDAKLLVIHPGINSEEPRIKYLKRSAFVDQFQPGDVLVVNAASTLPASFSGTHRESGEEIELRLAQRLTSDASDFSRWKGIILGKGNWRLPTEARTVIPVLQPGDRFCFKGKLQAEIIELSSFNQRFLEIKFLFSSNILLHHLYGAGRLIQYSYHEKELDLWDGQTIFAGKLMALEPPSAAFSLTWKTVHELQEKGIRIVSLFHAAGISSTGEKELDAMLPLPEYYQIPEKTAEVINQTKQEQRQIIALGTSVTHALESAATPEIKVLPGEGLATILLNSSYQRKIVTGLFTGMHERCTSHLQLLQSFASLKLIKKAYEGAKKRGYLWHEYGDNCLIV